MMPGPLMIDIESTTLSGEDRDLLEHPLVGGVILFSRNYESVEQLTGLVGAIHDARTPHLLVAVDQEGGRVQRFRDGFTVLPPCGRYGQLFDQDARRAEQLTEAGGWLMAAELRAAGIDFSFAPVLDLNRGISHVIDDRAFHRDPQIIATLARAFMRGMKAAGMSAVGKHFPGHGSVAADSHHDIPVDDRRYADIELDDLVPFQRLIDNGLAAIMPAHVIYPALDELPAGYSHKWLQGVLRERLGFQGVIFSDDLSMEGATLAGDFLERARTALDAGCDMALLCNDRSGAIQVIDGLRVEPDPVAQARLIRMHGKKAPDFAALQQESRWREASESIARLDENPELGLGDDEVL